ncbi:MAG: TolC family protein [candidate division WOR-3 bacterium]
MFHILLLSNANYAIDLKTAINKAIENYPSIKALYEESHKFEGKYQAYKSYLNPTIGLTIEKNINSPYDFSYSQPITPIFTYIPHIKMVDYEKKAFLEKIKIEKFYIIGEVFLAYYNALYKKELLKVAQENYNISEEIYNFVKKSFELGEATKLELIKAESDLELSKSELELSKNDYENSLKYLSSLIGENVADIEEKFDNLRDMRNLKIEELATIRYYNNTIKSISYGIITQRILALPQINIGVIAERNYSSNYILRYNFNLSIPIFYRRQSEISELTSQKRSIEKLKELEELKLERDFQIIRQRYTKLVEEIKKIEENTLKRTKEELSLAEKSYKLRVITLLELLDAKRRYIEIQKYRLLLIMQAHQEYSNYLKIGGEL